MQTKYISNILSIIEQTNKQTNKVKNECHLIRQDNTIYIFIFDKIIYFKYRTRQLKATETNK